MLKRVKRCLNILSFPKSSACITKTLHTQVSCLYLHRYLFLICNWSQLLSFLLILSGCTFENFLWIIWIIILAMSTLFFKSAAVSRAFPWMWEGTKDKHIYSNIFLTFTQLCLNNFHNKACKNECLLTRRLAREMVYAVDSASCWHLSLSAVAFSKLAVSLARFLFSC